MSKNKQIDEQDVASGSKPANRVGRSLADVLNGNVLAREEVVRHLPFLFFLVGLALLYIANGYVAEDTVRSMNKMDAEIKELRSEFITIKSDLMYTTKQSELVDIIQEKGLGLKESFAPPQKLVVESETYQKMNAENE